MPCVSAGRRGQVQSEEHVRLRHRLQKYLGGTLILCLEYVLTIMGNWDSLWTKAGSACSGNCDGDANVQHPACYIGIDRAQRTSFHVSKNIILEDKLQLPYQIYYISRVLF